MAARGGPPTETLRQAVPLSSGRSFGAARPPADRLSPVRRLAVPADAEECLPNFRRLRIIVERHWHGARWVERLLRRFRGVETALETGTRRRGSQKGLGWKHAGLPGTKCGISRSYRDHLTRAARRSAEVFVGLG